jgi:hypothetical protein
LIQGLYPLFNSFVPLTRVVAEKVTICRIFGMESARHRPMTTVKQGAVYSGGAGAAERTLHTWFAIRGLQYKFTGGLYPHPDKARRFHARGFAGPE